MKTGSPILMVFDLPRPPLPDENFHRLLKTHKDYKDEKDVVNALASLGYQVDLFGVYKDLSQLVSKLSERKWHLVFVMCESFRNQRDLAPHVVSLLEMMGIKYSGATSTNLQICRDKALTKKILNYHDISVPEFAPIKSNWHTRRFEDFPFPAIVKPLNLEASEGISRKSVVASPEEALKRAKYIEQKWRSDVIIEEFIHGREFYVGVVGNKRIEAFPPQELVFGDLHATVPRIASYRVKWDLTYKKSRGIDSQRATSLSLPTRKMIEQISKKIYQLLGLQGYARLDLRMDTKGTIYFIEANPNPAINKADDFAASARNAGVSYTDLIDKIVKLGVAA